MQDALRLILTSALDSVGVGIAIFAVGILLGFLCVFAVDRFVRRRLADEHDAWVAAGRPERRRGMRHT